MAQHPTAKRPTVGDRWAERPGADLCVGLAAVAVYLGFGLLFPVISLLPQMDWQQRQSIYTAGAGLLSLVAGFSGVSIGQYGSSTGKVMTALKQTHGRSIRKNWVSIVSWLLFSALACLLAIALNKPYSPRTGDIIFLVSIAVAISKFWRIVFLFRLVLSAQVTDSAIQANQGPKVEVRRRSV